MEELSHLLEFFSKLIFGVHLTLSFSGISYQSNKKSYGSILYPLILILSCSLYLLGEEKTISIYPLLIHLPLILFLTLKEKHPFLHAVVSLFFAFQFLSPRLWLGLCVAFFYPNNPIFLDVATVLLSIPFAWCIDRYFAPEIAAFKEEDKKIVLLIGLAPLSYYFMTYAMVIYSDILLEGGATLVDFIDGTFTLIFILYTVFSLKILQDKKEIEVERAVFVILQQANRAELIQLHRQEEEMKTYRHDLRHHIHYLEQLLEENKVEEGQEYLRTLLLEQKQQVLFADHESVKLLLSQFEKRGAKDGISMNVELNTSDFSGFDQLNLCSLLSNGLENALKFSKEHESPEVFLEIYRENRNLSIYIKNNYNKLPEFNNLRPITKEQGHGYGTKSMALIVEKYNGFSQFYVEQGYFIFRATLMAEEKDW